MSTSAAALQLLVVVVLVVVAYRRGRRDQGRRNVEVAIRRYRPVRVVKVMPDPPRAWAVPLQREPSR